MQFKRFGGSIAAIGFTLVVFGSIDASAASRSRSSGTQAANVHASRSYEGGARANVRAVRYGMATARGAYATGGRYAARSEGSSGYSGRLQCVPFARENTGIELSGNASGWWSNAEGVYARGARPEVGSILNFRANGRMRMGHVAVVSNVVDARNIQIDHANWSGPGVGRGGVSRNITVVDVSERNDWTAVRVALGHSGEFGSVYPTYGFIYDRADTGVMMANNASSPAPVLNAAPRDLRPAADRIQLAAAGDEDEVAEAEDTPRARYGARRTLRAARSVSGKPVVAGRAAPGAKATVQRVSNRGSANTHAAHAGRRHRL